MLVSRYSFPCLRRAVSPFRGRESSTGPALIYTSGFRPESGGEDFKKEEKKCGKSVWKKMDDGSVRCDSTAMNEKV